MVRMKADAKCVLRLAGIFRIEEHTTIDDFVEPKEPNVLECSCGNKFEPVFVLNAGDEYPVEIECPACKGKERIPAYPMFEVVYI